MEQSNIRNFAIIAHIDHGKSTLADRIMELTQTVSQRESKSQLLDDMEVERAHQVTVKSRTVQNKYRAKDGKVYELNLIDTPGHVDFSYEVSRSLSASDGVILLVDATQGVQAQTVANYRLAKKLDLPILPVLNKIDSPNADIERTTKQLQKLEPSFKTVKPLMISAKTGKNIPELLEALVNFIPAPRGKKTAPLKALVFDVKYDQYQGVVAMVRVFEGQLTSDKDLLLMAKQVSFKAGEIGIFSPEMEAVRTLATGEVGYVITGSKDINDIRVGDTLTAKVHPAENSLPGYRPIKPMVYMGIYPRNSEYKDLKLALEKLALNDPALYYAEETSDTLGPGFRGGFLGMFHLQIIRERLKEEYGIDILTTSPNVSYRVHLKDQVIKTIDNPVDFPYFNDIVQVDEPFVMAQITVPSENVGDVLKLTSQYRGKLLDMNNEAELVVLDFKMPLAKVAYDFFNQLKSITHGYATLDIEFLDHEPSDVVKVVLDINYAAVDALAFIIHRSEAYQVAQELVKKLKYTLPRRLYPTAVQALVEGKVIARVDVPPLRKNAAVNGEKRSLSKKQALLRNQKHNKAKAKNSHVRLPQAVFDSLLEVQ